MNRILPALKADYDRWAAEFTGETDAGLVVTVNDVLRGHYLLVDYFLREKEPIGAYGPRNRHLLPSAVYRQVTSYGGRTKWETPIEKCATLFFGLIMNHPFHDGNKRTALLMLLYGLLMIGRIPTAKQSKFERVALHTAGGHLEIYRRFAGKRRDAEVVFIADFRDITGSCGLAA